jgi:hypothetical protein
MDAADAPVWLTTDALAVPIARLLGRAVRAVLDWTCHRVVTGAGAGLGVWRLAGTARTDTSHASWSLILKGWMPLDATAEPSISTGPQREMELYRSGLLADLPGGIRAPACYDMTERPDGSVWMWLEEIREERDGPWSLDRYATAARHLGRFNGAYLTGVPRPEHPWVSRDWLRHWVEPAGSAIAQLQQSGDPLIRRAYPPHVTDVFSRLWADRQAWLALLDQLPRTFYHLDAFRRNLFLRRGRDGTEETVAIDWEFAGDGAIGEELAPLVVASIFFLEAPVRDILHLESTVLTGYTDGLRDVGWTGDPDMVWAGYRTAAVLRYGVGVTSPLLPFLLDARLRPRLEQFVGQPWTGSSPISPPSTSACLRWRVRCSADARSCHAARWWSCTPSTPEAPPLDWVTSPRHSAARAKRPEACPAAPPRRTSGRPASDAERRAAGAIAAGNPRRCPLSGGRGHLGHRQRQHGCLPADHRWGGRSVHAAAANRSCAHPPGTWAARAHSTEACALIEWDVSHT